MVLLRVLILVLFTFIVARLFGARATISERTMSAYFLLGTLYGVLVLPLLYRIVSPYGEMGSWIAFFGALAIHGALLAPIVLAFFRSKAFRALSIADVFLAAFMIGLGSDAAGLLLASLTAPEPVQGYTSFPPFQWRNAAAAEGPIVPGHAYWIALTAMAVATAARFIRKPWAPWAVGGVFLLFTAFEAGALRVAPQGIWETLFKLSRQGGFTAWLVLLGVVGLSFWEAKWEAKHVGEAKKFALLEELQTLFGALVRGRFREFRKLAAKFRFERQARLMAAEAAAEPQNGTIRAGAMALSAAEPPEDYGTAPLYSGPKKKTPFLSVWGGWILLAFALFLLPRLPEGFRNWLWSFWGIHYALPGLPFTILTAVLTVVLVRRIVNSGGRPAGKANADDFIAFVAERGMMLAAFGILLVDFVYQHPERLVGAAPFMQGVVGAGQPYHSGILLLVIALAATGFGAARSRNWQNAPIVEKRRAALRYALEGGAVFAVVWAVNGFYFAQLVKLQEALGPWAYRTFQADGNYPVAIITTAITVVLCAVLLWVVRGLIRRTEAFMVGAADG